MACYAGPKAGETWDALQALVQNADVEIERAYRESGGSVDAIDDALDSSDTLEITLNMLGTKHAVGVTGDTRLGDELLLIGDPKKKQVLPGWMLEEGRKLAADRYKGEVRVKNPPVSAPPKKKRPFYGAGTTNNGAQGGGGKKKGGKGGGGGAAPPTT